MENVWLSATSREWAALVDPVGPSHRGELDIVDHLHQSGQARAPLRHRLGLEESNRALCQRVVVGVPGASD